MELQRSWAERPCMLALLVLLLAPAGRGQIQNITVPSPQISAANVTQRCYQPMPCTEYLRQDSICVSVPRVEHVDRRTGVKICVAAVPANDGDRNYFVTTGMAASRCIQDWKGDGRCDLPNNHANENCGFDGGDCCLATCQANCAQDPDFVTRTSTNCEHFCGERTHYLCLDDQSVFSVITTWCMYGDIRPPSECYYSKLDVAQALLECVVDDRAHGNALYASPQCGNKTQLCTVQNVEQQNGCHLPAEDCFHEPCCELAIKNKFIEANPQELPTLQEIYDRCENGRTKEDEPCFKFMVKCFQENRAYKGGCCQCQQGWAGWRCRWPLCWPRCVHGTCAAPDLCHCDAGWKGSDCSHAVCTPECVPGQGICVQPNRCECFYGWTGTSCELPNSVPACVNGDAVAPDICRCAVGWGGRLCDYPLCQSWPMPNAECGHGSCVRPYECECEPGWATYRPINATGYAIRPWWSKGQDVSIATGGTFVIGDSRIIFMTYWDRIYNSSNAEQCWVPDCALLYDTRCTECDPPPGGCTDCERGFFLDTQTGRCERCSNVFPHCQLCGRVLQGPDQTVVLRCLHCDPLYVLEPVNYTSLPSARCVSDGTVEFSSSLYHVFKDQTTVNLLVQRTTYGLDPSYAKPVEVLVRTRDVTAHSRSLPYAEGLANFEFTAARVTLGVDHTVAAPPHDMRSPQYDMLLEARVQAVEVVPVRIYDDVSYYEGMRYFDVDLILPPEHLMGHQGPLRPFLTPQDHETTLPWMSPQDFGRTPLMERQDVLATTRVYIWDRDEATAANTTCGGDCQAWSIKTIIHTKGVMRIYARTHFGARSMSLRDRFLVKYRPMARGFEDSVGIVLEAVRDPREPGTFVGNYYPIIPGPYKIIIEKAIPGIRAEYWWHRGVHRNPPQLPDTTRIDHALEFYWNDTADAPAFVRWHFHLHFECIRSQRWPRNFGHALGLLASPGSRVAVYFWNDGLIEERVIPYSAPVVDRTELIRHDCKRRPDGGPAKEVFLCVEMLDHNPVVDPEAIYPFMVEFTPPTPEVLAREQPAFIQMSIYHQNDTDYWSWWPVQPGCLLSSGLHIAGSPFEGFEALTGQASPLYSTVMTLDRSTREVVLLVDTMARLRVDLRDDSGVPLFGGEQMLLSLRAELRTLDGVPDGVARLTWDQFNRYYSLVFTARVPASADENIQVGRYQRELHVLLDGQPITYSPMLVTVLMGFSDPQQARIISGRYTPARASEQMWFQLQSVDATGRLRTTGGDVYEVHFDGPRHAPLPSDQRFEAIVTDTLNGTYNSEFEIQRPGLYKMHVLMRNRSGTFPIMSSPFAVTVYDELDPGLTRAEGFGVDPPPGEAEGTPARIRAGQLVSFVVTARDTYDAPYFEGGARFRLEITVFDEAKGDFMEIRDRGDGRYDFSYQICQAGLAYVSVTLYKQAAWHHIKGSPFAVEVVPGSAKPQLSVLHPLASAAITYVPTSARIDLKDVCGNIPGLDAPGGSGDFQVSLLRVETGEDLPLDVAQAGLSEVMLFWTPGRRGLHELSAQFGYDHILGSPLHFNVTPAGFVPTHLGAAWVVGGVGASSQSTFQVLNSPAEAAAEARIHISSKDMWGDPLVAGNDTFLIGLWREGGPCPTPTRCLYFSQDNTTCAQVPSCRFDPYKHVCHSGCGPTAMPNAFMLNLPEAEDFRLVDPSVDMQIVTAREDFYDYAFTTPVAGRYYGTVSVLRPGGLRFFYFDSDLMLRRIHTDVLKGPVEFDWGFAGPPGPVPAMRFAMVAVGWLRVPAEETYTLRVESDGSCRVVVNGTEIVRTRPGQSMGEAEVYLRSGFVPLQVEYVRQHSERAVGSRFSLRYGGGPVPMQVVPADAIYFEDVLTQLDNPFVHMVQPLRRAVSLAIDGMHEATPVEGGFKVRAVARVGQELLLRLHSVDHHGNVLVERDPTSLVHMYSEPVFTSGDFQGGNVVADRWRIVPLANGSWNVIMRPIAAPAVYNVTFELKSLYIGGVAFRRKLRVFVEQSEVYPPNCWTICVPPTPQIAGTEVTCTVVTRDREGSELSGMLVQALVLTPSGASELTQTLDASEGSSRRFYFVPTVVGTWTVKADVTYGDNHTVELIPIFYEVIPGPTSLNVSGTQVVMPSMLITEETLSLNFTLRDYYGNLVSDDDAAWRVRLHGGFKNAVDLAGALTKTSPHSYEAVTPRVMERALYKLEIEHVDSRHRNNYRYCPQLSPIFGRVISLSDQRALGSVALLACLSGHVRASGATTMRCEEADDGSAVGRGEWTDLLSQRASFLVCRPKPYYCAAPDIPNSDITYWGWRREVGSRAAARCRLGYEQIYGDNDFVCGSRAGVGTWLTLDGDDAIMPVCTPIQHLCPNFELRDTHIVNMSEDRIVGSVVYMACDPGTVYVSGDDVVVCNGDGGWKRPEVVSPALPPEDITCFRGTAFCTDPSPYLEYGAQIRGTPSLQLAGIAEFECIEGWTRLLGDTTAVCSRSRANDLEAGWFASDPAFGGQVDLFPLRCYLVPSWCPPIFVERGHLVSLSNEHYLGSQAVLSCGVGYERVSGYSHFECRHNATKTGGLWETLDGLHGLADLLRCEKIYYFCPEPVAPATVQLSLGDGLRLGSVLAMGCANGYELDTPLETPPTLVCQSGPGGVGEWATPDGLAMPVRALACRGVRNWCPELSLPFGSVADIEGARGPGSSATLGCDLGYELQVQGRVFAYPERVKVVCDEGTDPLAPWLNTDGGFWTLDGGNTSIALECVPVPRFCQDFLPAYTRLNGVYQAMNFSTGTYTVEFFGDLSLGSRAVLRCNEYVKYFYSYGDTELVCSYDANKTGSVWRSTRGMIAVPLHCYYTGTPLLDYVEIRNGCFDPTNYLIDYTFGRSGSIVFWLHPSAWPPGSVLIQGEHGNGQWEVIFIEEGVLSAKVTTGVGHVELDITQNNTKGIGDWFHIAFIWELGLGLAGLGDVRLWVDGVLAEPATPGSHRLDHFTWVEPSNLIHIGDATSNRTTPGDFSNLRVYSRSAPESEIREVRESEDPRCGIETEVCQRPSFIHAHVISVHHPTDERFALFPLRPEAQLTMSCDPGYTRTRGDEFIECTSGGAWIRGGATEAAQPLECCQTAEDWCPPLNLSSRVGLYIYASSGAETVPCIPEDEGGSSMGIAYVPCPDINLPFGTVSYTNGLEFGSRASLACNAGYEPVSELDMDAELLCFKGVFNYTLHPGAVVPGDWKTLDGRPSKLLQCRGLQNWCPEPELARGRLRSSTAGRRMGSEATLECLPGYKGSWGNLGADAFVLHATCGILDGVGDGGNWTVPLLHNAPLAELSCELLPDYCPLQGLRALVGVLGELADAPEEAYSVTLLSQEGPNSTVQSTSELGSRARLQCVGAYEYSHGDVEVVCGHDEHGQAGAWLGLNGRRAARLRCRDTRPAVPDADWFSDRCFGGSPPSTKVPYQFGPQGTVALWLQLPNSSTPRVAWASPSRAVCAGYLPEVPSEVPAAPGQPAGEAEGSASNATNESNASSAGLAHNDSVASLNLSSNISGAGGPNASNASGSHAEDTSASGNASSETLPDQGHDAPDAANASVSNASGAGGGNASASANASSEVLGEGLENGTDAADQGRDEPNASNASVSANASGTGDDDTSSTPNVTTDSLGNTLQNGTNSTDQGIPTTVSTTMSSTPNATSDGLGDILQNATNSTDQGLSGTNAVNSSHAGIGYTSSGNASANLSNATTDVPSGNLENATNATDLGRLRRLGVDENGSNTSMGNSSMDNTSMDSTTSVGNNSMDSTTSGNTSVGNTSADGANMDNLGMGNATGNDSSGTGGFNDANISQILNESASSNYTTTSNSPNASLTTTATTSLTSDLSVANTTVGNASLDNIILGNNSMSSASINAANTDNTTGNGTSELAGSNDDNVSQILNETNASNYTSRSTLTSSMLTTATTSPMEESENDTQCLGEQHMIILDGALFVQLGEGIGNISVPLEGVGPDQWMHLAYIWSSSGAQANLFVATLGTGPDAADNVTLLASEQSDSDLAMDAETVFEIHLGLPPKAALPLLEAEDGAPIRSLPRAYGRPVSDREASDLSRFEVPTCESATCPDPPSAGSLIGSFIFSTTSDHPRVPPEATRPGTRLYLSCNPGYGRTGGHDVAECAENGTWVLPGTDLPVAWLECCQLLMDYCPEANLTYFRESWAPDAVCGAHYTPMVRGNGTAVRRLGAKVFLECPPGYVKISGSDEQHCALGLAGSLQGRWVDPSDAPAAPLVCELDDHWCPSVQGERSFVYSVTAGRRLGSMASFRCSGSNVPFAGNVTLRCMLRSDGLAGHWVDSYGKEGAALRCGPRLPEIILQTSVDGGQEVSLNRRFLANASLACISTTRQIHGDSLITCVLGPDGFRPGGTGGRWVDEGGSNAELPICELRPAWCPPVDIVGKHSTVVSLTDNYRHGSVAALRCHVGYRYLSGNLTLECINNPDGFGGVWNGPPLTCELDHHFCPPLRPVNASVVESNLNYTLGEAVTFQCHRGFRYLSGDYGATCLLSDSGYGGQWKRLDGTTAEFLVCVPQDGYCSVPDVAGGYLASLTFGGHLGSVVEMKCRLGFWDYNLQVDRQVAVCMHSEASQGGAFVLEAPYASRDLLRAVAFVGDLLEMLEDFEEEPFRIEDVDSTARLAFSSRWGAELRDAMRRLRHSHHVREMLTLVPGYDAVRGEPLSYFDIEHVRTLHRLLVSKTDEVHDISATEARTLFGSFSTLKINFQDADTPAPDGWLPDSGHVFGERGNGFTYGWKCDTSDQALNSGAHNRKLSSYTVLENTVIVTDLYSTCENQEWRIELPTGRYYVEVVIQDPVKEAYASGCMLQGEHLAFPEVVQPPGRRAGRHLVVDVVDVLTFSGDGDTNCTSVNRITIQAVEDAGSRDRQEPLLNCSSVPNWCPPFRTPEHTHVSSRPDTALGQPLGGTVEIACDETYVRESGSELFVCGSDASGRFGEWMMPGGRRAWHPLTCAKGRDWCPPLVPPEGTIIKWLSPPSYEYYTRGELACRKGLRRVSGNSKIQCDAPGEWCNEDENARCAGTATFLQCEPDPVYCPALLGVRGDQPAPEGHEAVAVAQASAATPRVAWVSMVLPLPAAPAETEVSVLCPQHYHRVWGDEHVVCKRGAVSGVWQKAGASTSGLVDDALAEPVVCELDPIYGVKRLLYTSADQLHIGNASVGEDVVPNIDQQTSEYDAAHFQTHLRPPETGLYALSVEVLGKFALVLEGRPLLEGRSTGPDAERFRAEAVELSATEFYTLRLQYELDPRLPGRANVELDATLPGKANHERVPRLVRLFWEYGGHPEEVVPPTALRHTFLQPSGFPREIMPTNDPAPCKSGVVEEIRGLQVNNTGVLLHGTVGRSYGQDLLCQWRLLAVDIVRFTFYVNFFDLEDAPGCAADRVELRAGTRTGAELVGSFCGTRTRGEVLVDLKRGTEMMVDFITDSAVERTGFNITYAIGVAELTPEERR